MISPFVPESASVAKTSTTSSPSTAVSGRFLVYLTGLKTGGLSLTSIILMQTVAIDSFGGQPLSAT